MAEVGMETYARALLLSRRLGEKKYFSSVLGGAWLFHTVRGELLTSEALGRQFLELAQGESFQRTVDDRPPALWKRPVSFWAVSRRRGSNMEQALAARGGPAHFALTLFSGTDAGVFSRSYIFTCAVASWDMRMRRPGNRRKRFALAGEAPHPFTVVIALDYAAMLHVFRQDSRTVAGAGAGSGGALPQVRFSLLPGVGRDSDRLGQGPSRGTRRWD